MSEWPGFRKMIYDLYGYKGKSKKWARRRNKLAESMIMLVYDETD